MNKISEQIEILILVGGQGTRLKSIIQDMPKPMAPINGVPFLEIQLRQIVSQGFHNIRLLTGFQAEKIQEYFKTNSNGAKINYTIEKQPLGTGGAIFNGIKESSFHEFIIFNGDTYFDFDLLHFAGVGEKNLSEGKYTINLNHVEESIRYGFVEIDNNDQIKNFNEKPIEKSSGFINAGVYFFDRTILTHHNEEIFSIETQLFPKLSTMNLLKGHRDRGTFIDIGIPEDYYRAQALLKGL